MEKCSFRSIKKYLCKKHFFNNSLLIPFNDVIGQITLSLESENTLIRTIYMDMLICLGDNSV